MSENTVIQADFSKKEQKMEENQNNEEGKPLNPMLNSFLGINDPYFLDKGYKICPKCETQVEKYPHSGGLECARETVIERNKLRKINKVYRDMALDQLDVQSFLLADNISAQVMLNKNLGITLEGFFHHLYKTTKNLYEEKLKMDNQQKEEQENQNKGENQNDNQIKEVSSTRSSEGSEEPEPQPAPAITSESSSPDNTVSSVSADSSSRDNSGEQ